MRYMWETLLVALSIGLLCGCGVGKPLLVGERPEIAALKGAEQKPIECHVRVLPAVISLTDAGETEDKQAASGNTEELHIEEAIAETLTEFQLFDQVVSESEAASPPYFDVSCEVTWYEYAYEGRNILYVPNLLCWLYSPWGSWFVADENFSASLSARVSVEDADTHEEVWGEAVRAKVTKALDDYQRGTKWFSIFGLGELTPDNWALIEKTLKPHVLEEFKAKLLERLLSEEVQELLKGRATEIEYRRRPQADWAIVVGINECPQLAENQPKWCRESAQKLWKVLEEGGYRVISLQDAKISDIKAALEKAVSQTDYRIRRLLFYFAGVGASEYKEEKEAIEQYLFGSAGEKLSLAKVAELVEKIEAQERMVILDAGFALDSLGRGIRLNKIPQGAAFEFPEELTSGNCGFLSACGPGQGAAEDDKCKACLFTYYMLKALSSSANDKNGDGAISLEEIANSESVQFDLDHHSSLKCGTSQKPFLGKKLQANIVLKARK